MSSDKQPETPPIRRVPTANPPFDPKEGCTHPPPPSRRGQSQAQQELRPALRWMRGQMVREFVNRLRARQRGSNGATVRGRMRKRKAALAMSAAVMGLSTAAVNTSSGTGSAYALELENRVDPTEQRVHPVMLRASSTMKEALAEEEGVRLTVYRDVAGYPTVGVGHLVRPQDGLRVGDRITYDQAIEFLERDLRTAERAVKRLAGDLPLYQHEFDALVDLVYNVGEGNVSEDESPHLNAAIKLGDYESIASQLEYTTAAGRVARGLQYRSERRQAIFLEASYDDPRAVEVDTEGRATI